jgi:hypothetical protein
MGPALKRFRTSVRNQNHRDLSFYKIEANKRGTGQKVAANESSQRAQAQKPQQSRHIRRLLVKKGSTREVTFFDGKFFLRWL